MPDPKIAGEGVLDPLGIATLSDRVAEATLPGLRARMSRPRFLTAMAVGAAVCEGIEDQIAGDGLTPAHIVFEWLVVEAFARAADRADTIRTPGILKAHDTRASGEPMRASAYLRSPGVFGFHGIYRPLARQIGIVDEDMRLGDSGYGLVKEWQAEQGLSSFLSTTAGDGPGAGVRRLLRSAVEDALKKAQTDRSGQWNGWSILAALVPAKIGSREAEFIRRLLLDERFPSRAEVFRLLGELDERLEFTEMELVSKILAPMASPQLRRRLTAIQCFETACTLLEDAFDWIRYLSSQAGARAVTAGDFAAVEQVRDIVARIPAALRASEDAIANLDEGIAMQQEMAELSKAFDGVRAPEQLFEAILSRHHEVQQGKPPDGKRDWFERNPDGATFVRVPYRTAEAPAPRNFWNRPYRFEAAQSFLRDLAVGVYEAA